MRSAPTRTNRTVGRYEPRDRVSATRGAPRVTRGTPAARLVTPTTTGALPRTGTTRLAPRAAAPRLGTFRGVSARVGRLNAFGSPYRWGAGWGTGAYCGSVWNSYWGWGGRRAALWSNWNSCWSLGVGSWGFGWCNTLSPVCWTFGALTPYYAWRTSYWNNCYTSAYWNSWSVANALPSNYWWYPTNTYCPTYLYVPSSVVVYDDPYVDSGSSAGPSSIVIGGSIVDRARDMTSDEDEASASPVGLATKYVELGDYYFRLSRFEEAAEAYSKARHHAPKDASVHFVAADAAFANGDYHYAAFLISEGVRLDAGIVTADVDKRTMYGNPVEFEAQLAALQAHCKEKPYDAWAQLVLAYNLRFSGENERALAAFARVLELDPGNQAAQAFAAHLEGKPVPGPAADAAADAPALKGR